MSYCRWSDGDVYMFPHTGGGIECCGCKFAVKVKTVFTTGAKNHPLLGDIEPCDKCNGEGCDECMMPDNIRLQTYDEAIEHLQEHVDAGDYVPSYAFEALRRDKEEGMPLSPIHCYCGEIAMVFYPDGREPTCLKCSIDNKGE